MTGISSVTSITNIMQIDGGDFGIEVGRLVDEWEIPEEQADLDKLRSSVMANDMYRSTIVSDDGTATLIVFSLPDEVDIQVVSADVLALVDSLSLPENVYFTGAPLLVSAISGLITKDMSRLIPISFLVIGLVLFLGFKRASGVLLPLLVAVLAIVWTMGIMAMTGFSMSMISSNIPILLLAIGSAYSIHVVNRVYMEASKTMESGVRMAISYLFIPVLLAAITTAIGFLSFIFGSYLNMIRDYGLFTAIGTMLSSLLSLFLVPALMSYFRFDRVESKEIREKAKSYRLLNFVLSLVRRYPKRIIAIWAFVVVGSCVAMLGIKREVDIKNYFKLNNPTRKAEEIMTEKFGGTKPVFVLFKGDMQSPELLQAMSEAEEYMRESTDIQSTQSIAGLVRQLNVALGGEDEIPDERNKIEQLWFLIDGNEYLDRFVTPDLDEGIIISNFLSPDNQSKKAFAEYMNNFISSHKSEISIEVTGMPFVDVTMDESLVKSQIGSLMIAIFAVLIIVGMMLRSFRSGLLATMPIVCAILILFGFMGIVGIPLNIGTVLVASVALGIGIDYSIHIITHYNHEKSQGKSSIEALGQTIHISGKAIAINVISVSAGFLVLVFSEMVPLQYFGLLVAISMIGSSFGALTLLPSILLLTKK
jgi:predicted RND superfamily exporter protein